MLKQGSKAAFAALFIFTAGISAIGLSVSRTESVMLGLAWFSAFFAYFWICKPEPDYKTALGIGIAVRLLLFFSLPSLSDDVFRFIWDGTLLKNGISPFAALPVDVLGRNLPGLTPQLFERLNSPGYFTIYPPLNQLLFWLSVTTGAGSWLVTAGILRALLVLADIGAFLVLRKLLLQKGEDPSQANWFFLNPLLILEGTGNLHFEGLVLFFLLLGLYAISTQKQAGAGFAFGLAIATKILPLIFLPAILLRKNFRSGLVISGVALLTATVTFVPLLYPGVLAGIGQSLGLYFHKFEFNASIYYLFREIGYWLYGYNTIGILGPALSLISGCVILGLAVYGWHHRWSLAKIMFFSLFIYLLLSTTVHPWYTLPLIALGLLSGYYFPLAWSFLVFVSYFGYTEEGYELSWFWIVLEYGAVFFILITELIKAPNENRI